ncbi:14-3-3 domain-containing protein, partial [Elsinoe ampelina]
MATSDIDQKILCQIAKDAGRTNPLLSSAFYQILGLSVILSRKLYRARKLRRLDTTKSVALYHQIIWLSREGLAITEVMILPYCQNGSQSPRCRVMAAKLRASFYHVFCLFHNHPPISQLTPPKTSPNGKTNTTTDRPSTDTRARQAVLRETIPSMTSDASYVTNPYAFSGPAQTSPPPYPPPPIPTIQSPIPGTPLRPPGIGVSSPVQRSPPSSADFLMPPLNFVPAATAYFSQATVLARRLLPGSDPLRLSVAFESCAFSWECGKDFALAKEKAKATIRDVYSAPEGMEDADFEDAATLVQAIAAIAKRNDST